MLALYAPAVFLDGIVQKASLGSLLGCMMVLAMARWSASRRRGWAGAIGVVCGLLMLTRENAMVWAPIVLVWMVLVGRPGLKGGRWWGAGACLVGLAVVLVPVGARNAAVCGEWSVSTFQAGPNFFIGNSAEADGRYRPLVKGHETPVFERRDATKKAEEALGRELTPREVSQYWMSRAWADIRADAWRWVRLCGTKMLMVWNWYEVSDVESQYLYEDYSVVLRVLGWVWDFGMLCPLAALGIVLTWGRWRELWVYYALIGSMACSVALFYVMARYRFPLVPLLIPFAAAGLVYGGKALAAGEWRRLTVPFVVALIVAVIVNVPVHDEARLDAMAEMNLGVALAKEGELKGATAYFRRAVDGHPGSAEARNNLAQALALQDKHAEAIGHYEAALAVEPALVGVEYNLAVALERAGRVDEAIVHYQRAVELDPADADARRAVERLGGLDQLPAKRDGE
jgi:hypothetical protein